VDLTPTPDMSPKKKPRDFRGLKAMSSMQMSQHLQVADDRYRTCLPFAQGSPATFAAGLQPPGIIGRAASPALIMSHLRH